MQQKIVKAAVLLVGAGLLAVYQQFQQPGHRGEQPREPTAVSTAATGQVQDEAQRAVARIRQARNDPNAKFWTTVQGKVVKLLADDRDGDQHQRFLVEIAPDITLLVAHNIDLAQRAPVEQNASVTLSGEYVWNNRGGVMHWTHHNPRGGKGGWIEVGGKRYE